MERNMPYISHNRQTTAIFIPETYLPKMPRILDLHNYEALKDTSTDEFAGALWIEEGQGGY